MDPAFALALTLQTADWAQTRTIALSVTGLVVSGAVVFLPVILSP